MKTLFDEMEHAVKKLVVISYSGYSVHHRGSLSAIRTGKQLHCLSVIFSISMLISGIIEIIFSISNRRGISSWGWYLAGGIIDLILGIYLVAIRCSAWKSYRS